MLAISKLVSQMQVTTKITTQDIGDSDADVFVRVVPEGYYAGVIYTVYNTTNGTDYCSKFDMSRKI